MKALAAAITIATGLLLLAGGITAGEEKTDPKADAKPKKAAKKFAGKGAFGNPEEMFSRFDQNGDGFLAKDEAPEFMRDRFDQMLQRMDKDADGKISKAEFAEAGAGFRAMREGRPGGPDGGPRPGLALFEMLDADHDGKVSKDELAKAAEHLAKLDKNADGFITPDELPAGPLPGGLARRGDGQGPPGGARGGAEFFTRFDKDGDKKLSKDEAPERLKARFAELDKNSDGFLESSELTAAFRDRAAGAAKKEEK